MAVVRQALELIGHDRRRRWLMLVALALVVSGFETLGAALVYVLIGLVSDPNGDIDLPLVGDVRSVFGEVSERSLLLGLIAVIAGFFIMRVPVMIGSVYIQRRVAENAGARLSNDLVGRYLRWPYEAHLHRNSAEFVRNAHGAVQGLVSQIFVPMIRVSAEMFIVLGMLVLLLLVSPLATAAAVAVVGSVATALLLIVQPRLRELGRTSHVSQRDAYSALQQSLHGIREIKILGRERYFASRYAKSRVQLAGANYLRDTLFEVPRVLVELALIGFILLFFAVTVTSGGNAVEALPVLGLFAYAGLRMLPSVQKVVAGLNSIRFATAPLEDIHHDLVDPRGTNLPAPPSAPMPLTDALVIEGVSFWYGGAGVPALSDIDLTIRRGEQIGICGPTGGGKTTLVDIMIGLLQPTGGRLTVDGRDLSEDPAAWQRNLGVVPQMVFLLDDSLRRNIAFGISDDEIDDDAVWEAVVSAQLGEFVASLPTGLETGIGERGIRISGGQRQRIAIARALYRRPSVLLFDEGTSALDNATESQVMSAIESLRGNHTIILVAHRLSTVRNSDRVVFLEGGRITGVGTYDELYRDHRAFRAMART